MITASAGMTPSRITRRYCLNTPTAAPARDFAATGCGTTLRTGSTGFGAESFAAPDFRTGSAIEALFVIGRAVAGACGDRVAEVILDVGQMIYKLSNNRSVDADEHVCHHVSCQHVEFFQHGAGGWHQE